MYIQIYILDMDLENIFQHINSRCINTF